MSLDAIAGLFSLLCISVFFVLVVWILGGRNLYRKLSEAIEDEALPKRWLLLSFLPGFGHWFFRGYQENWQPFKLLQKEYEIKVTRDVSDAKWLIIQEHIDDPLAIRKGSTLTALKSEAPLYSFQEVGELPDEDSFIIRVTTPRKSYDGNEWARMYYKGNDTEVKQFGWAIQNQKSNIPILIRDGGFFYSIDPEKSSEIIRSNAKLYMGTTTYSLIKLPDLGVRRVNDGDVSAVVSDVGFIGKNEYCNIYVPHSMYPLTAIFDNGRLTVFGENAPSIKSFSEEVDVKKRISNSGKSSITYKLFVGDVFTIIDVQFIVDYV